VDEVGDRSSGTEATGTRASCITRERRMTPIMDFNGEEVERAGGSEGEEERSSIPLFCDLGKRARMYHA